VALGEGLKFVYLGNVPGHPGENTYCPGCGETLIQRLGIALVENRLRKGSCPDCGRAIPGIWT
jgi:pyruvate formate lyase activating enzyme